MWFRCRVNWIDRNDSRLQEESHRGPVIVDPRTKNPNLGVLGNGEPGEELINAIAGFVDIKIQGPVPLSKPVHVLRYATDIQKYYFGSYEVFVEAEDEGNPIKPKLIAN